MSNPISNENIPYSDIIDESVQYHLDISLQSLEINEESQNCCICMEYRDKDDICELNCKHKFCWICIKSIISKKNSRILNCPLCRDDIKNIITQKIEIQNKLYECSI